MIGARSACQGWFEGGPFRGPGVRRATNWDKRYGMPRPGW